MKVLSKGLFWAPMLSPGCLLLTLGLLILALAVFRASVFLEQDRCLDSGGCWDHGRSGCEYEDQNRCRNSPKGVDGN